MVRHRYLIALGATLALCPSPVQASPELEAVALVPDGSALSLRLPMSVEVSIMHLAGPHRLVVDIPAISRLPGAPGLHKQAVGRWGVRELRTSQFRSGASPLTRIVLELDFDPEWDVQRTPHQTRIQVNTFVPPIGEPIVMGVSPEEPDRAFAADPISITSPEAGDAMPPSGATGTADPESGPEPKTAAAADAAPEPSPDDALSDSDQRRPPISTSFGSIRPHVTVDPTDSIRAVRQRRLWSRRAAELIADARLRLAAADYRRGLESLTRVFRFYPAASRLAEAHTLAAEFYCELHIDDALDHLAEALADPAAPDSVVAQAVSLLRSCPLGDGSWPTFREAYERAAIRVDDPKVVAGLGGRLGILLAEAGEALPDAVTLLNAAVAEDPDAPDAAELHRAIGLIHERTGDLAAAARSHLFAARLMVGHDRDASAALRLRAADAQFEAGDLEEAAEQYSLVAALEGAPGELRSWALFQLGTCYYRSRRFQMASEAYDALRVGYPASFWAEQATVRLAILVEAGHIPPTP